jgi:hypothetical protein
MREIANNPRIKEFLRRLGSAATSHTRIYITGGATAVLLGWRDSTIDVDIKIIPDRDEIFRAIPSLKEDLQLNVELASPDDFIPALPGWESRCVFISREGMVDWYHYDPYAQALAKIQRDHQQDRGDVRDFIQRGFVKPELLRDLFHQIVPHLIRYPSIDPEAFAKRVDSALSE